MKLYAGLKVFSCVIEEAKNKYKENNCVIRI